MRLKKHRDPQGKFRAWRQTLAYVRQERVDVPKQTAIRKTGKTLNYGRILMLLSTRRKCDTFLTFIADGAL